MVCYRPFLAGAGHLPEKEMRGASQAISQAWGLNLLEYACGENPREVLHSLAKEECLVSLFGDPATHHLDRGSWLEALADWRQPTILLVSPDSSGELSGTACAYAALCETLSVPLVGIVQVGGSWNALHRRLDGLPWCGWLPSNYKNDSTECGFFNTDEATKIEEITLLFRLRIKQLNPL